MNKIIIILVIFVMLFSGFTLLENSQTNNFYENKINTNNFISSNSPIYNLTIYIHNSPAGNGYYQQLFNFNSTSYFINNLNQNASNFYISYENGTLIYSWIQNWNFTTKNLTIWSKLQNGTKVIMIEIFNQNTNLLSANGFIGEAPELSTTYAEYDNGYNVFPTYQNFAKNINGFTPSGTYNINNGINMNNKSYLRENISRSSGGYFGLNFSIHGNMGGNYEYIGLDNRTLSNGNETIIGNPSSGNASTYFQTRTHSANIAGSSSNNFISNNPYFSGYIYIPSLTPSFINLYSNSGKLFYNISTQSELPIYKQIFIDLANNNATSWLHVNYIYYSPTLSMPTYTIELNIYNVNIKSFDKQSNSIHNYFFYNNSVYSSLNNTFVFKNKTSFFEISLIPLNFSTYFTNFKNITISQSQFINNNNSYYYNLSIYYYNSNLNTVNPYDFANYIYPISILVFLLLGGIILFGTIKYRRSN